MSLEEHHVCFVVTGEFMTQQARTWWADEGHPEKAVSFLLNGLNGITIEQVMFILEGKQKLIGDSTDGIDMVPDDTTYTKFGNKLPTLVDMLRQLKAEKDELEDGTADLIQLLAGETEKIASPTGLREIPRRKRNRPKLASLEASWDDIKYYRHVTSYEEARAMRIRWSPSPLPPDEKKELLLPEPIPPPPAEKSVTTDTGWLLPDGKFYPCLYMEM